MKDKNKLRSSWTVSSLVKRLVSVPRAGLRQQGIGNFLFAALAALLIVCIVWGPTVSPSTKNATHTQKINPKVYEFIAETRPALDGTTTPESTDAAAAESAGKEETKLVTITIDGDEDSEEEKQVLVAKANTVKQEDVEEKEQNLKAVKEDVSEKEDDELQEIQPFRKRTINVEIEEDSGEKPVKNVIKEKKEKLEDKKLPRSKSLQKWDTSAFRFGPKYSDWDKQRAAFLKKNPHHVPGAGRKSDVMLVTSSSPLPCTRTIGNYLEIISTKNKVDYTRLHEIQLYVDISILDPNFDGQWNKIALLRMLMVKHPEIEWFWWMDMESWITDMAFEIPFDKYKSDGKNLFLYGDEQILYGEKSWLGISTGDFGIRNCQWSLDLLDSWASFGVKGIREKSGTLLSQTFEGIPDDFTADVQSSLAYLLIHEKKKWASKVALEMSYTLSGNWPELTPQYEELLAKSHPGFGDQRWPFSVNFASCQQCSNVEDSEEFSWETCYNQMLRTYDFADSQVLQTMGFKLVGDLGSGPEVVPLHGEQPPLVEGQLYHIYPNVSDWDQQRAVYLKKSKNPRDQKGSKPRVLLASGSAKKECPDPRGTPFLLKALKNKIDYARLHNIDFYYNLDNLDKELTGWWMKIPIIRAMMLAHPEAEWIWWVDSDAVFTDMVFEPPFEAYTNSNLILWGDENAVYKERSFVGINAGIMIIRNCQWSLDFFDSIVPYGPKGQVRNEYGQMLAKYITQRPDPMEAEDQASIVYKLSEEKEKWGPKTLFENSYTLSGSWPHITNDFEKLMAEYPPGTGDWRCPLVTHFAGCGPCSPHDWSNFDVENCYNQMERTVNFADNQIRGRSEIPMTLPLIFAHQNAVPFGV
ncbi:hypothetical protein R1sor_006652 [Riccia sorocarpa]|uniref:Uncharacterized protein n=1 Tax=Riccia sorocarpa TaxID=122646 RepID=A0ABD3HPZ2_9MARC